MTLMYRIPRALGSKTKLIRCLVQFLTNVRRLQFKGQGFPQLLTRPNVGSGGDGAKLGAKYNSVKDAFAKLAKDGLLQRSGRGNYEPNYAGIVIHLMDRVEELEKKAK